MSRYSVQTGIESEYEPGSRRNVLKNLLSIRSKSEMDKLENQALKMTQTRWFSDGSITAQTRFTADILKLMHKDWLGDIYEWAGKYRTVNMSKDGFMFPPAAMVPVNMERFEHNTLIQHTPCIPGALSAVSGSLAIVHAELLLIHPFREGNGRLARWLADMMAAQAGYPLPSYGFIGRGSRENRASYLQAVVKGYMQNYAPLALFFERAIRRRLETEGLSSFND